LSGGQLHRLILLYWLYQILHNNIKIILLDEPDKSCGSNINDILNKLFNHILFKNKIIIITSYFH
jgi:ABC-type Mn2+/Zn2+ transport system ATPase subunit